MQYEINDKTKVKQFVSAIQAMSRFSESFYILFDE